MKKVTLFATVVAASRLAGGVTAYTIGQVAGNDTRTYTPAGNLLDATLGKPVSAGCVRMRDEDVGWLDQHLPLRSTVVVY